MGFEVRLFLDFILASPLVIDVGGKRGACLAGLGRLSYNNKNKVYVLSSLLLCMMIFKINIFYSLCSKLTTTIQKIVMCYLHFLTT